MRVVGLEHALVSKMHPSSEALRLRHLLPSWRLPARGIKQGGSTARVSHAGSKTLLMRWKHLNPPSAGSHLAADHNPILLTLRLRQTQKTHQCNCILNHRTYLHPPMQPISVRALWALYQIVVGVSQSKCTGELVDAHQQDRTARERPLQ